MNRTIIGKDTTIASCALYFPDECDSSTFYHQNQDFTMLIYWRLFYFLLIFFSATSLFSQKGEYDLLWKVTKPGNSGTTYIFGTVYLCSPDLYHFSDSVLIALDQCQVVAFEASNQDLSEAVLPSLMDGILLPKRSPLFSENPEMNSQEGIARINNEYENFLLTGRNEYFKSSNLPEPAAYLEVRARYDNRQVVSLANPHLIADDVLLAASVVNGNSIEEQKIRDEYFQYCVAKHFVKGLLVSKDMVKKYKKGNLNALEKYLKDSEETYFQGERMQVENVSLSDSIEKISGNQNVFVCINVARLIGTNSLLHCMESKGYQVSRVDARFTSMRKRMLKKKIEKSTSWLTEVVPQYKLRFEVPNFPNPTRASNQNPNFSIIDPTSQRLYVFQSNFVGNIVDLEGAFGQLEQSWLKDPSLKIISKAHLGGDPSTMEYTIRDTKNITRMRAYFRNGALCLFLVTTPDLISSNHQDINHYLESIVFTDGQSIEPTQVGTLNWSRYYDKISAFSVEAPCEPKKQSWDHSADNTSISSYREYSFTESDGSGHYAIYLSTPAEGFIRSDNRWLEEALAKKVCLATEETNNHRMECFEQDGLKACRIDYYTNGKYVIDYTTWQGNITINLVVECDSLLSFHGDKFVNSFQLEPIQSLPLREYAVYGFKVSKLKVPGVMTFKNFNPRKVFPSTGISFLDGRAASSIDVVSGAAIEYCEFTINSLSYISDMNSWYAQVIDQLKSRGDSLVGKRLIRQDGLECEMEFVNPANDLRTLRRFIFTTSTLAVMNGYFPRNADKSYIKEIMNQELLEPQAGVNVIGNKLNNLSVNDDLIDPAMLQEIDFGFTVKDSSIVRGHYFAANSATLSDFFASELATLCPMSSFADFYQVFIESPDFEIQHVAMNHMKQSKNEHRITRMLDDIEKGILDRADLRSAFPFFPENPGYFKSHLEILYGLVLRNPELSEQFLLSASSMVIEDSTLATPKLREQMHESFVQMHKERNDFFDGWGEMHQYIKCLRIIGLDKNSIDDMRNLMTSQDDELK